MDPVALQSILQDAGVQVDTKNLQNPTEEFMLFLIRDYFDKFHLDGNEISKSTPEQLECFSCPESAADVIKVLNFFTALSSFCKDIFLTDFCLTDITSPGPKRARKQIKILFNFFAYVRNKLDEHENAVVELDNQEKEMESMINQKNLTITKIGATINSRENKIELQQQINNDIVEISAQVESKNKISKQLEQQVKDTLIKYQDKNKRCKDLKAKACQLHKIQMELQSKIVESPEEYTAKSKELKVLLEKKKEERQELNDNITSKKSQIKKNECAQELVNDLNGKFPENISQTCKQLKEISEKLNNAQKKLQALKTDIAKWSNIDVKNLTKNIIEDDFKGHKQLLLELGNQYEDKERDFQSQNELLEVLRNNLSKKKVLMESELKTIMGSDKNNSNLLKQYQELFQNEWDDELRLRNTITQKVFKINTDED